MSNHHRSRADIARFIDTRPDSFPQQSGPPVVHGDLSDYFVLRCVTCKELLPSMLATTPDEILMADSEQLAVSIFHQQHAGHALDAVPFENRFDGFPPVSARDCWS